MDIISILIGLILGASFGGVLAYIFIKKIQHSKEKEIIEKAHIQGENIKKDKIIQAKEKFLELKEQHEKTINSRERKIQDKEFQFKQRENNLKKRANELKSRDNELKSRDNELIQIEEKLKGQIEGVRKKEEELIDNQKKQIEILERVSGFNAEQAKEQLMKSLEKEAKSKSMSILKEINDEALSNANREAKKILIQTIQRVAAEQTIENAVSVFNIESDDLKGRIIGREGRNIRAIEAATGVEIIVDDTPEAIILSCFDPVRREIARLSLHQLVTDGRIHPARIEEVVSKT